MSVIAQIIGLLAVTAFLLSYQQKKRRNIIFVNVISRCLYILQYFLLGAFSGAVLDVLGAIASFLAGKKQTPFIQKHLKTVIASVMLTMLAAGITIALVNKSFLDLFSLIGVLLHTGAFWLNREKTIRWISLFGSPFWFIYNFFSRAYGSALGDLLTVTSIIVAMVRYQKDGVKGEGKQNAAFKK